MIKHLDKQFPLLTFVFLSWVTMWVSINAIPYEIEYMTDSFINFINGSRSIAAILFSVSSLVLLFFLIILKKIKKLSIILSLFALYFIFQFIGLVTNEGRVVELTSTYLILYALGTISVLMIIDSQKLYKILPYFFYFSLSILTVAYLIILTQSTDSFTILFRGNFYRLLPSDEIIFNQAVPKVTGLTRSFGIISLSLLIIFAYKKRTNLFSSTIFSLIVLISIFIWMGQSRGTLICYYITSIFFIIFLNNFNQFKKFLIIISITFFSIVVSNETIKIAKKIILKKEISILKEIKKLNPGLNELLDEIKKMELKKKSGDLSDIELMKLKLLNKEYEILNKNILTDDPHKSSRIFEKIAGSYTSGRFALWKNALERYEKNRFFGYGPQADRIMLFDPTDFDSGNNVSNTMIYGLLSGGYFSLTILILIYIYTAYIVLNYFLINKIFLNKFSINKENIFVVASIVYTVFFMIRSLFENSFGVFSIDFLIVILSLFIIENKTPKKKINFKLLKSFL